MKISFLLTSLLILAVLPLANAQDNKSNYGNTPDELLPYGKFKQPYIEFLARPQPFLGTGRDKKAPANLQTVKIGFLGPLQGTRDVAMGKQMLNGATLAIEEANQNGGFNGVPFELMLHNDAGIWGAAANEIVKMDDEKVWAILGSIDGNVTHVALRVALKLEIPMVNTGDSDPTLTETGIPWIIRVIGDDRQSGYALANYIFLEKNLSRVAVLRVNNRYGRVGSSEFKDAARRLGFPLVLEVRYTNGDTTFLPQLKRINHADADAILLWVEDGETAANIVKEMAQLGMDLPVFGCDRIVSEEFIEKAGNLAEGLVATYPYNPSLNNPQLIAFNKNYVEKFNQKADMFAAHAYDGMNILIAAINKAGLNRVLIRDLLTDLKTFQGYEGVTGKIIFDATWNDIGPIWMAEVRNGKFIFSPASRATSLKP